MIGERLAGPPSSELIAAVSCDTDSSQPNNINNYGRLPSLSVPPGRIVCLHGLALREDCGLFAPLEVCIAWGLRLPCYLDWMFELPS